MEQKLSMRYSRDNPPDGVRYEVEAWIARPYRISRIERISRWFIIRYHSICAMICGYFTNHQANYIGTKYEASGQTWNCWCGQFSSNMYDHKPYQWRKRVQ